MKRARYDSFDYQKLLSIWYQYNLLLLHMFAHIPKEHLPSTIRVGDRPALTLSDLIKDYFAHMELHEEQVRRIVKTSF